MNNEIQGKGLSNIKTSLDITLTYLDPKSIANLALVCRELRLSIGKVLKKVLEQQFKYYQQVEVSSRHTINYLEYKQLLQQCQIFDDSSTYAEFINKMNSSNKFYFINFFSVIFNMDIKITNTNIYDKKEELKLLQNEVYLSLFQLQFQQQVPKLNNQCIYYECYDMQICQIVCFVNSLLAKVKALQRMDNPLDSFIAYKLTNTSYLQQFSKITDIKITNQYQQKIYYLTSTKSYHSEINFNVNSVILSFLNIKDLQKVRSVDKMLNNLVKNTLQINLAELVRSIYKTHESLSSQINVKMIYDMINLNKKITMTWSTFYSFNLPPSQPIYVDKLLNLFLGLVGISPQNITFDQIKRNYSLYDNIFNKPYQLNIDNQKFELLDQFFKEEDIELIKSFSTLSNKICSNLQILYSFKKHKILPSQVEGYSNLMQKMANKITYGEKIKRYYLKINQK